MPNSQKLTNYLKAIEKRIRLWYNTNIKYL